MDKETLAHIFEPFFTTKGIGKGTGLGLATIIRHRQAEQRVHQRRQRAGSWNNIQDLPAQAYGQDRAGADHGSRVQPVARGHETILLVEDETGYPKTEYKMLEKQGYTVLAASTPGEAIRLAREHIGQIDLLMTDVVMPEMNGRDLAKNLLAIYPHLKRLFISGYTADIIAHHGVLDEGVHFIQKPFSSEQLAVAVREALNRE